MRTLRRLGPDVWLLCASVIAAAAVGRLFQGGLGGRASGPLLVSAAVGSAVPALLALKRVPLPIRAVVGTIAVILTSLWTAIGAATAYGLPTAHTWHVAQSDLRGAATARATGRPAPPHSGAHLSRGDGLWRRRDAGISPPARQRHTWRRVPSARTPLPAGSSRVCVQPKHAGDGGGACDPLRRRRRTDLDDSAR